MEGLKGALLFGQSGGPTAVINASALGVFEEALKNGAVTKVFGACHGIKGVLDDKLVDIGTEDASELRLLIQTPSSALGSVRYKLANLNDDDRDYKRIHEIFAKYDIRFFLYNGGNDSMDTCNKISKYLSSVNYACNVVGVPKTIDNDLYGTDHCPGYGSAAKYIATTCMEIALDSKVYDKGSIAVIEIMGRHAGWLTAASAVASYRGLGPDLIYLPETPFDVESFLDEVYDTYRQKGNCIAAVSEGICDESGKYIAEYAFENAERDSFNHIQLGGVGNYLGGRIKSKTGVKVRPIEFSLMQRCAAHIASKTDVEEAYEAGAQAVRSAVVGSTDVMIGFRRAEGENYVCECVELPLSIVANTEKKVPLGYITEGKPFITPAFLDYVTPLIQGEVNMKFEDGLPRFAKLNKKL
ncbi:MAG: 6-phosphofructokinase [Clostridia bacterium]|nr:6-phosphofructokinase [Clostridia bacterium]